MNRVQFVVFNFCHRNVSALTNYLVSFEKSFETLTPTKESTRDRSNEAAVALGREVNAVVEEFILSYPRTHAALTLAQDILTTPLIALIFLYFVVLLLTGLYVGIKRLLAFRFLNSLLLSAEQEFATPRAILLLTAVVCCLLFASSLSILFGYDLNVATLLYATALGLILALVLLIPFNLIYN